MNSTVFLCGFMGCGKTTVGKELAKMLGCKYADMDEFITQKAKMSIPMIFAEKGEDYFRSLETSAVSLMGEQGGVISCGGGAMLTEQNAEIAARYGTVIYIDTPYETCWERICEDKNRPIVIANTKKSLGELYDSRKKLYEAHSKFRADGSKSPEEIAAEITQFVK